MFANTRRFRWLAWPAVIVLLVTACGSSKKSSTTGSNSPATTAAPAGGTGGTVNMRAGLNDPQDHTIAVLQYLPGAITVAAGTSVQWTVTGPEPHSITFFPPGQTAPPPGSDEKLFAPTPPTGPYDGKSLVNSGLIPQGPAPAPPFAVTFPTAGKYTYQCVIHPQMVGTVNVVDAGQKADTQADVTARGESELNGWLAEGRAAKQKFSQATPVTKANADGTTTYTVEMGTSTPHTDILAFAPVPASVKPKDSVTFVNNSAAPHTATFAGQKPPLTDPTSAEATKPAPGPSPQTLNATDLFNTGTLPPNAPPGAGPPLAARSFTFKVPSAGTYAYYCVYHQPSGMGGTVKAT